MRALLALLALLLPLKVFAAGCTVQTEITGIIGPATVDLFQRLESYAASEHCRSALLLINTPGGNLESTRTVVEGILNSPIPILCLVAPSGGHAGSAGAIILQACHVNGALQGTNLGAATPVALGHDLGKDLRRKILNDTRSWMDSLTALRGRNKQFGEDIITQAKAVTADEAYQLHAVDFVGGTPTEFLKFAEGRDVKLAGETHTKVEIGPLEVLPHDLRFRVIALLTDPEFAYMMLLGSLGLLYLEFTHPGTLVPGTIGGLGLVISLLALNKLDVEWTGLILILGGIGMLVAELFLPTFGIVGFGGLVAFVLGSLFLFDPIKTGGYHLPLGLIIPVTVFVALVFVGLTYLVLRTTRVKKRGGFDDMVGEHGRVVGRMIEIKGELWKYQAMENLNEGDQVKVVGYKGLILEVIKEA